MAASATPTSDDVRYLDLLSIFHYVVGGMAGLFACFPIIHLVFGIMMLSGAIPGSDGDDAFPLTIMGVMFTLIPALIILLGWAFAACVIMAGRNIKWRRHYMFCMVMAGIECLFTPFGTVLGVFTLILLTRPGVRAMFEGESPAPAVAA
jgi:hypothetical protein